MLADNDQSVLAGGHTHVPLVRRHRSRTLINPGSVGLPFASYGYAGGGVRVLQTAAYGIVSTDGDNVSIELREVGVDVDRLTQQVRSSGMPRSDWYLALRADVRERIPFRCNASIEAQSAYRPTAIWRRGSTLTA